MRWTQRKPIPNYQIGWQFHWLVLPVLCYRNSKSLWGELLTVSLQKQLSVVVSYYISETIQTTIAKKWIIVQRIDALIYFPPKNMPKIWLVRDDVPIKSDQTAWLLSCFVIDCRRRNIDENSSTNSKSRYHFMSCRCMRNTIENTKHLCANASAVWDNKDFGYLRPKAVGLLFIESQFLDDRTSSSDFKMKVIFVSRHILSSLLLLSFVFLLMSTKLSSGKAVIYQTPIRLYDALLPESRLVNISRDIRISSVTQVFLPSITVHDMSSLSGDKISFSSW
jgi:hypothetical protein